MTRRPKPIRPPLPDQTSHATISYVSARTQLVMQRGIEDVMRTVDALPWCRKCDRRAAIRYVCETSTAGCGHEMGQPRDKCGRCAIKLRDHRRWLGGRRIACTWCGHKATVLRGEA